MPTCEWSAEQEDREDVLASIRNPRKAMKTSDIPLDNRRDSVIGSTRIHKHKKHPGM